jgi:hypothetical protein
MKIRRTIASTVHSRQQYHYYELRLHIHKPYKPVVVAQRHNLASFQYSQSSEIRKTLASFCSPTGAVVYDMRRR